MKGTSPRGIAFLLASIVAVIAMGVATWSLSYSDVPSWGWIVLATGIGTLLLIYIIAYYIIRRFIYEKIRVVYKSIRSTKGAGRMRADLDMKDDVIGSVNREVLSWARARSDEIEQLKEQEAFRREFIGNVAHELKTPVFSIQGYILTLLEGGLEDPKVNREFLRRAANGVERMTGIIEDLDEINRYEAGKMEMNIQKINIVELAAEVMEDLELKADKRKVKLRFNRSYEKPIWVKADKGRIGQVFTNLLANSINYNKKEGFTEVRFYDMDEHVLVEVADNGIGIAETHLPRLFERFYRVDKSRSRHEGGTGLGLAIVKHIIEGHDQSINVRSTEGVGSTFSFTLAKA